MSEKKKLVPKRRFKEFENADPWEQRKLGKLADFSTGYGYTKSDLKKSGTPIILYGRLYNSYQTIINKVDTFADVIYGAVFSEGGEVILPSSGETSEDIAIAASVDTPGFLLGGGLNIVNPSNKLRSVFLALEISYGHPHIELAKKAQGKSVVHLYNEDLKEVKISFPTIEEQMKISQLFENIDNQITLHQRAHLTIYYKGVVKWLIKLEKPTYLLIIILNGLKFIKKALLEKLRCQNIE